MAQATGEVSRIQSNPGEIHQTTVKNIFNYLRQTKHHCLAFGGSLLKVERYTNPDFQLDPDNKNYLYYIKIILIIEIMNNEI